MKKGVLIAVLIMFFATAFSISAQNMPESPITWRMTVKMTSPDEGIITLRATIEKGWHLYNTTMPDDGPVPTTFDFAASKGVKFIDKFKPSAEPVSKNDPNFGLVLQWWESNVSFSRKFRLTGDVKDAEIVGSVRFMGCNDMNCLPPKTVPFKSTVKPYTPSK